MILSFDGNDRREHMANKDQEGNMYNNYTIAKSCPMSQLNLQLERGRRSEYCISNTLRAKCLSEQSELTIEQALKIDEVLTSLT